VTRHKFKNHDLFLSISYQFDEHKIQGNGTKSTASDTFGSISGDFVPVKKIGN